jgi:hypothetical protein
MRFDFAVVVNLGTSCALPRWLRDKHGAMLLQACSCFAMDLQQVGG